MSGIIGRKIGMTSIFDEAGNSIPCTLIQAGPCVVTQVKNAETDGYRAVQLAYGEKKEKRTSKALKGHFDKSKTSPKQQVREFRNFRIEFEGDLELGKELILYIGLDYFCICILANRIDVISTCPKFTSP